MAANEPEPIESFFRTLSKHPDVRAAIHEHYSEQAVAILAKLGSGEQLSGEELGAHDIVVDLVKNESEVIESLTGVGDYGEFSINIMQFGSAFWIEAPEFDDIGYFPDAESARSYAEINYEPFISAAEGDQGAAAEGKGERD